RLSSAARRTARSSKCSNGWTATRTSGCASIPRSRRSGRRWAQSVRCQRSAACRKRTIRFRISSRSDEQALCARNGNRRGRFGVLGNLEERDGLGVQPFECAFGGNAGEDAERGERRGRKAVDRVGRGRG